MNRYLSTVGLYARLNLYKILLITLVTALLAGFLVYRYPMGELVLDTNYDNLPMVSLLSSMGFCLCGQVSYGERGLRFAFEKITMRPKEHR